MGVKSIVDIEVNDSSFKAFTAGFARYQSLLKLSPTEWAKVQKYTDGTRKSFDELVKAQISSLAKSRLNEEVLKKAELLTRTTADRWRDMSKSTLDVSRNIKDMTVNLLRWASLTTVFSGLLGAGGLFGIDRLANSVGAGRRQTSGVGVDYGQKKSFDLNYGRLVNDGFLENVNAVLHDVSKRSSLYGAGLGERDVAGKNTAEVGALLIPALKRLADRTPDALLAQVLQSRGLDQVIGLQEFQRLKKTSPEELAGIQRQYGSDTKSLSLSDPTQKAWQDLSVQISRAGEKIENVFVRGLEPLAPSLTKLSDSFADTVKTFLAAPDLPKWIESLGRSIETFAKYVGSEDFQSSVRDFVAGVGVVGNWVGATAGVLTGSTFERREKFGASIQSLTPSVFESARYGVGARPVNNPGNLRPPGQSTGFMQYPTEASGLRAMARQLLIYQDRDHLNTVQGIVSKYAPSSENDVKAYVGDVANRTGFGANQKLDLSDPEVLAKLIAAMTKHENSKSNYSQKDVVEVLNNTGGNAVVLTNQVAR